MPRHALEEDVEHESFPLAADGEAVSDGGHFVFDDHHFVIVRDDAVRLVTLRSTHVFVYQHTQSRLLSFDGHLRVLLHVLLQLLFGANHADALESPLTAQRTAYLRFVCPDVFRFVLLRPPALRVAEVASYVVVQFSDPVVIA